MFSKYSKVFWVALTSLMISNVPHVAVAEGARQMISTSNAVEMLTRHDAELKIRSHLSNEQVKEALEKYGVSASEVQTRLASLSETELSQLAQQMDQARFGGDAVTGVLVLVVLVLLIVFLVKRI